MMGSFGLRGASLHSVHRELLLCRLAAPPPAGGSCMKAVPVVQYLYYLSQIGIYCSPLCSNAEYITPRGGGAPTLLPAFVSPKERQIAAQYLRPPNRFSAFPPSCHKDGPSGRHLPAKGFLVAVSRTSSAIPYKNNPFPEFLKRGLDQCGAEEDAQ